MRGQEGPADQAEATVSVLSVPADAQQIIFSHLDAVELANSQVLLSIAAGLDVPIRPICIVDQPNNAWGWVLTGSRWFGVSSVRSTACLPWQADPCKPHSKHLNLGNPPACWGTWANQSPALLLGCSACARHGGAWVRAQRCGRSCTSVGGATGWNSSGGRCCTAAAGTSCTAGGLRWVGLLCSARQKRLFRCLG